MTVNQAIAAKGQRVTADKGQPSYTGTIQHVSKIADTWYASILCDDGETRNFRTIYLKPVG